MNYKKRLEIVAQAKAHQLKHESNDIRIKNPKDTTVTITFYTDQGLNDHYSGFVYTNDSTEIETLDAKVKAGGNDFRLEPNWYLIHD